MSLSAITRMSCRAAGSMFSRLATLRLLPRAPGRSPARYRRRAVRRSTWRAAGKAASPALLHAEHDLRRRVVLIDKGQQIFVKPRLVAVQRLQHRDRRAHRRQGDRGAGQNATPPRRRRADKPRPEAARGRSPTHSSRRREARRGRYRIEICRCVRNPDCRPWLRGCPYRSSDRPNP